MRPDLPSPHPSSPSVIPIPRDPQHPVAPPAFATRSALAHGVSVQRCYESRRRVVLRGAGLARVSDRLTESPRSMGGERQSVEEAEVGTRAWAATGDGARSAARASGVVWGREHVVPRQT